MTSRQVQWRRFQFFDKDTVAEDVALELGAEVTCMHTAAGRLYLGGFQSEHHGIAWSPITFRACLWMMQSMRRTLHAGDCWSSVAVGVVWICPPLSKAISRLNSWGSSLARKHRARFCEDSLSSRDPHSSAMVIKSREKEL